MVKSVNEQFPDYPLPSHRMGDGKLVIMGCIALCILISIATVLGVIFTGNLR